MTHLRFNTVKDLFDAYPTARNDIGTDVSDEPSLTFLARMLNEKSPVPGLSFCAYLLPRREAVGWGCKCLRQLDGLAPEDAAGLAIAEEWVRDPAEERRHRALLHADKMDVKAAATWIVYGAGWAGGTITYAHGAVPISAHSTAQAIRTGLIVGSYRLGEKNRTAFQARWLDSGIKITKGEESGLIR